MSDEEGDYMSDKFLTGIPDVRPSLVYSRAKKREYQMEHKHKDHIKKQKETRAASYAVNNDKLQEALSKPLESDNKGFKLLAKMGYKPGQTLGKTTENDSSGAPRHKRLLEPIGITIKSDRQGLGRAAALQELMEKRLKIHMQRLKKETGSETTIEEFRKRTTQKTEDKFVATAIRRCQKTCENLDLEFKIETPAMPWFWPEKPKDDEDNENENDNEESTNPHEDTDEINDEEEEDFNNVEKLEMLTSYVRTSYNYCYWCGVRYENAQDLLDNCPGLTKDDH